MKKRYHIQDTVSATIEEYGNSVELTTKDVDVINKMIKDKDDIIGNYHFKDNEYGVVTRINKNKHTKEINLQDRSKAFNWNVPPGFWEGLGYSKKNEIKESIRFDVIFHHKATANYGKATYALYKTGNDKDRSWRLSYIGNPTTLINGHNSGPVVLKDKPGFYENMELHRVGFDFFFLILGYTPSKQVESAIKNGLISLQNTQFAIYVPSEDKNRDLTILKLLYCRPLIGNILKTGRFHSIGELLGIKPSISSEDEMTGLMLRGYSGKNNPTYTLNMYDKSLANKSKKKRGISSEIKETLKNSIRVDITLHRRFIDMLANRAFTIVKKRILKMEEAKKRVNHFYRLFVEEMQKGHTSSALVMCMIMHVLPKSESFAKFLLRTIVCEELLLDKILKVSATKLVINEDQVNKELFTIYEAWKAAKTIEQWKEAKAKLKSLYKGKSNNDLYRDIKTLEALMGVSLDVPYLFWLQTATMDGIYGLRTKDLELIVDYQDREPSNDFEEDTRRAVEVANLLRKGRKKINSRRKYIAKTFLEPIGLEG
mgnify:CR=1 FL=1